MTTVASTNWSAELWSDEQLMSLPRIGKAELVDGKVIMAPAGSEHSVLSLRLAMRLATHVDSLKLGLVFESSAGFRMKGGNILSPDVAFVGAARLKGSKRLTKKYFTGAPDLAVEIISPNDKPAEVEAKIAEYFDNGTKVAWVIDPGPQTARAYTAATTFDPVPSSGNLSGGAVVPGFTLKLADLFALPDFG